jgi:hypothetical protein
MEWLTQNSLSFNLKNRIRNADSAVNAGSKQFDKTKRNGKK